MTKGPRPDSPAGTAQRPPLGPDFRTLFESAPECFLVLAPDPPRFTILAATDAYLTATRTRREEIVGRPVFEVFPDDPDDPTASAEPNSRASFERALELRIPDTMAVQKHSISRPESQGGGFEARYWSPLNTPILDANGEVLYLMHRVEDVTEYLLQKRKEAEQQALADLLQTRTGEMEVEIFRRAQEVQEVNRQLYAANGRLEELVRTNEEMARLREESVRTEEQLRATERARGELERLNRALELNSAEQSLVETQLKNAAEQRRLALESAQLGCWEYDVRGGEILWDERCRDMFGVPAGSRYAYLRIIDLIHPDDRPGVDEAVGLALAGAGEGVYSREFRVLWPGGSLHWVASRGQVYFAGEGSERRAVQFVGVCGDITKRKAAETELQRHRDHLELLVAERTAELELRNSELEVEMSQRKFVMELLSKSERRYRAVLEDQTETISRFNRDGSYTFVNDVYCRFFGKSRAELVGSAWMPAAHPDDLPMILERLSTLSPASPVVTIENRVFNGSGEVRWMQFVNRGFFDERGELVESQAVGRDITEQKRIKQALFASEEQYRQLFEQMISGVVVAEVIFDAAGESCDYRLLQVNPASERLSGLIAADLIGRRGCELAIGWTGEMLQRFFRVAATGEPIQYERYNETLGRHFETRVFSPRPGQFAHIFTDITERKRFEATVRAYAEEILDLYNHAPCGYHSLDAYGVIVRINDTELEMLGYREDEVVGKKRFVDLLEPEARETFGERFADFKETGSVTGLEYLLVRKDGSKLSVLLSATAIRDGEGNFVMSRGTLVDITDRKRAEDTLRRYAQRLIEMDEVLRRQLAAELHDELGQELTVLGLNISLVGNNLSADARERVGARIEDCSQLVKGMSRSLRQLMLNLRPSELDEYGLVSALRWHAGLFSKRTGVVVDFQADQRFPRLPEGAESALFRIAQEALLNVAKHTKASRVVLRLATSAAKLSCSLADDGAGFDPEALLQPAGGNGWGLTIMRERAELIGASFLIESTPGRGTTVTVSLSEDAPCR